MQIGYRGWKIKTINNEPTLVSPSYFQVSEDYKSQYVWAPGENVAQCEACGSGLNKTCHCGLYALKSPNPDLVHYRPDIIGQVLIWGSIIEGDLGFRAKKAIVSLLFLPSVYPLPEETLIVLSNRYNAGLVRAEGKILEAISRARKDILINQGKLQVVAAQEIYKRDWGWVGKTRLRSGERL